METVNDIIKEMREVAHNISVANERTLFLFRPVAALHSIADRLGAAHKREIKSIVDANEIAMKTAMDEVAKLRKTNEVLECARDLWFERAEELRKRCDELYNGGAK